MLMSSFPFRVLPSKGLFIYHLHSFGFPELFEVSILQEDTKGNACVLVGVKRGDDGIMLLLLKVVKFLSRWKRKAS